MSHRHHLSEIASPPDATMTDAPPLEPEYTPGQSFHLFFSLPRELRDRIYTYALSAERPIVWPCEHLHQGVTTSLLCASKAILEEAAPLLYTNNTLTFLHPSDCNMFLWNHSPALCQQLTHIHLRIRAVDIRLWSGYLSSTNSSRSLVADYPNLKHLDITFRSSFWGQLDGPLGERFKRWQSDPRLRELCLSLEGKTPAEVRLLCVHRVARADAIALINEYPKDLRVVGPNGEARTGWRKIFFVDVSLEVCPVDPVMG